jgi:hypothetical protein
MVCGEQQPALHAQREADDDRAVGLRRVHHGDRIGGELGLGVRLEVCRSVGAAVATRIEGEHATMPREVGDLHLPLSRVHQ